MGPEECSPAKPKPPCLGFELDRDLSGRRDTSEIGEADVSSRGRGRIDEAADHAVHTIGTDQQIRGLGGAIREDGPDLTAVLYRIDQSPPVTHDYSPGLGLLEQSQREPRPLHRQCGGSVDKRRSKGHRSQHLAGAVAHDIAPGGEPGFDRAVQCTHRGQCIQPIGGHSEIGPGLSVASRMGLGDANLDARPL